MQLTRVFAVALLALLAGALPALAEPAYTSDSANVRSGPSPRYKVITTLPAGTAIDIGACNGGWCVINAPASGYVDQSHIASSYQPQPVPQPQPLPQPQPWPNQPQPQPWPNQPQPQPWPNQPPPPRPWPQQPPRPQPLPQPPVYDDAGACFFSERNFRGNSFCLDEGESLNRLRTWNDSIRSVQVFGGAQVDVCSDQNLYGVCATLNRDTSRLPQQLDRNISSIDVY